jgi:hypothetical protein
MNDAFSIVDIAEENCVRFSEGNRKDLEGSGTCLREYNSGIAEHNEKN